MKGSTQKLHKRLVNGTAEKIFNSNSREEFIRFHGEFCEWGTRNIFQAERKREGKTITRQGCPASYGQIAETVTLKVSVYYCRLPNHRELKTICRWLNAAVDTVMMCGLKEEFSKQTKQWSRSIKEVDKPEIYKRIQRLVRKSIKKKYQDSITCPEWDDIRWGEANQ
ncbi:MAG: hypothetical protein ACOC6G_04165 [Thermoproteota archaeon]